MLENETVEFKKTYKENIYKEIVAFLNSYSGTIYVGYDDNGELVGLNEKGIEERISNEISQKIVPDCSVFVSINNQEFDGKKYIVIKVNKGVNIYSLKDKGVIKGTYIRSGSCSIPASEETIKQMIMKNNNITFETSIAVNQDLTFNYIKSAFNEININLEDDNIMRNLHLKNNNGLYTNLALLLSDQNPYTIKIATYESYEKTNFLDRKEFSGSLLELYDKALDYLKLNSATYGMIKNSIRKDIEEYPEFILREIILNSLIHRDFTILTSNIINIYKNKEIEFISYGSLYGNITIDDVLAGLSTSRNPYLQAIFVRLKRVEAIGSGLRRVNAYYVQNGLKMQIKALPSSFIVILPKIEFIDKNNLDSDKEKIMRYLQENQETKRSEVEKILNKEKTSSAAILNALVDDGVIIREGNGPGTKYRLNKMNY